MGLIINSRFFIPTIYLLILEALEIKIFFVNHFRNHVEYSFPILIVMDQQVIIVKAQILLFGVCTIVPLILTTGFGAFFLSYTISYNQNSRQPKGIIHL